MKKLLLILSAIWLLIVPALAQTQVETYRANAVRLTNERKAETLQDYEQALKLDRQLKAIIEKKIALAREKMQENENQPK